MYERKATAFSPKLKANWNLGSLANQRISYKHVAVNSTNRPNKIRKGPSLSWKLVFKSFQTVLSRTQEHNLHNSRAFWSRQEKQPNDVRNLLGRMESGFGGGGGGLEDNGASGRGDGYSGRCGGTHAKQAGGGRSSYRNGTDCSGLTGGTSNDSLCTNK